MELGNFYTGFGILLVYFTLVWQSIREKNKVQVESALQLVDKHSTSASKEQVNDQAKELWKSICNPLNVTIIVISISGILAFYKIIQDSLEKIDFAVESIVLLSIVLLHLIISIDLWIINMKILYSIFHLKKLKV